MFAGTLSQRAKDSVQTAGHSEGTIARTLEDYTARLPSDVFLWSALGAIGLSLAMSLSGRQQAANFVGHWVPTLLIFGLYNKIVKVAGHERKP